MALRLIVRSVFDLLLPNLCVACGDRPLASLPLCAPCRRLILPPESWDLVKACGSVPEADGVTALWMLESGGGARAVLHALKYRGLRRVGPVLGEALGEQFIRTSPPDVDVIFPVPLHRVKLRERGYNQAAAIASGLACAIGVPVSADSVVRTTPSASQTRSGRRDRTRAVDSAFAVMDAAAVAGLNAIVVDDVITTGATASAVCRVLREAGVRSVHVAAVGLTRPG